MLCPSCGTENNEETRACGSCGVRLSRKANRRTGVRATPANPQDNRLAWTAYDCSLYSMIPIVGLVLGPIGVLLGLLARRGGKSDTDDKPLGPSAAAIILGLATTSTQWLGL